MALNHVDILKSCTINLGFYGTGTSTLSLGFQNFGFHVHRDRLPLSEESLRGGLICPEFMIKKWWCEEHGSNYVLDLMKKYDFIFDGWIPLLMFLSNEELFRFKSRALSEGIKLNYIATNRNVDAYVRSELHHWVNHNLEMKANLTYEEKANLSQLIRIRILRHARRVESFQNFNEMQEIKNHLFQCLPLKYMESQWPATLSSFTWPSEKEWSSALETIGVTNENPSLPVEAILLTFRVEDEMVRERIHSLLDKVEQDEICRYLLVIALDVDDFNSLATEKLIQSVSSRQRVLSVTKLPNLNRSKMEPIPLCQIWNSMAEVAWSKGADWTIFLGDDIRLECPFHYRAIYRAFMDISIRFEYPFGFGCPWLNDVSFPGFPTFPVISKVHRQIFGGLIPYHRRNEFINQDLDPYLRRLYAKFASAPLLSDVKIENQIGGEKGRLARYKRVPATRWRHWVLQDTDPIERYLDSHSRSAKKHPILVDVVIPTYRIDLQYLSRLCALQVPNSFRTTFLVIVDNPKRLQDMFATERFKKLDYSTSLHASSAKLERYLRNISCSEASGIGNNIRVRCNSSNLGALASRNRGIEESSAEYILFLDDDILPDPNLLDAYEKAFSSLSESMEAKNLFGMVGLVKFPRRLSMPIKHAAVLSSQLHSMFEIAQCESHKTPAWGVTANLLTKRLPDLKFNESFAKDWRGRRHRLLSLSSETFGISIGSQRSSSGSRLLGRITTLLGKAIFFLGIQ
ncbi:unnamed protein product [Agarophyton chilense]